MARLQFQRFHPLATMRLGLGFLMAALVVVALAPLYAQTPSAQQPTTVVVAPAQAQVAAETPPPVPLGLPPIVWPADNPYTKAKADLGRLLYYDTRMSSDNTISCATCHAPQLAFTDNLPTSFGIGRQLGARNSPTVINRAYGDVQFWDGRASSLEEQAKGPLANPVEMTLDEDSDAAHKAVVSRIRDVPGYLPLFQAAFGAQVVPTGDDITIDHVAKAIATYERTVLSGNSAYDRYMAGDKTAMTEAQIRGMNLFNDKAQCAECHLGPNFTDELFANIGVGMDLEKPDLGRFDFTGKDEDKGAFKTPTLRDIEKTAPYMHDGSMATLEEVVEHYNDGGIENDWLDERIFPLYLNSRERADLVEFMKALNGTGWQDHTVPAADEFPK